MNKKHLSIGIIIGFTATFLTTFLFLEYFTTHGFTEGIKVIKEEGYLGKATTIVVILNIIVFFVFLQKNQDIIARGIIAATIICMLITLFI